MGGAASRPQGGAGGLPASLNAFGSELFEKLVAEVRFVGIGRQALTVCECSALLNRRQPTPSRTSTSRFSMLDNRNVSPHHRISRPNPNSHPMPAPALLCCMQSKPGSGGVFISPIGIAQALAMLLNGVQPGGESYRQLLAAVFSRPAGPSSGDGGGSMSTVDVEALTTQLRQLSNALVKVGYRAFF